MNATCAPRLRCLLVWGAATVTVLLAVGVLGPDARALRHGPGPDLEVALVRCGSVVLLGCAGWAWLATTAVVAQAVRGRVAAPARGVPDGLRRLVLLACGATLAAGLASPAVAEPGLSGLPLPDRATGAAARTHPAPPAAAGPAPADRTITVRPGDSLWDLAAGDLDEGAAPARVAQHWQRLYRLNRPVVGPDPDLIHPGQQLRLPPPPQETP